MTRAQKAPSTPSSAFMDVHEQHTIIHPTPTTTGKKQQQQAPPPWNGSQVLNNNNNNNIVGTSVTFLSFIVEENCPRCTTIRIILSFKRT